jgi:hypothetical protein
MGVAGVCAALRPHARWPWAHTLRRACCLLCAFLYLSLFLLSLCVPGSRAAAGRALHYSPSGPAGWLPFAPSPPTHKARALHGGGQPLLQGRFRADAPLLQAVCCVPLCVCVSFCACAQAPCIIAARPTPTALSVDAAAASALHAAAAAEAAAAEAEAAAPPPACSWGARAGTRGVQQAQGSTAGTGQHTCWLFWCRSNHPEPLVLRGWFLCVDPSLLAAAFSLVSCPSFLGLSV